jgi:hypothetical protein
MSTQRWYEMGDCPDLDAPPDDYPARVAARTDELLARVRALREMGAGELTPPVELDAQAIDEWLDSYASRDYPPQSEE